jgi:hypothetical protein
VTLPDPNNLWIPLTNPDNVGVWFSRLDMVKDQLRKSSLSTGWSSANLQDIGEMENVDTSAGIPLRVYTN